jgi:hypothetical protein
MSSERAHLVVATCLIVAELDESYVEYGEKNLRKQISESLSGARAKRSVNLPSEPADQKSVISQYRGYAGFTRWHFAPHP